MSEQSLPMDGSQSAHFVDLFYNHSLQPSMISSAIAVFIWPLMLSSVDSKFVLHTSRYVIFSCCLHSTRHQVAYVSPTSCSVLSSLGL